MSTPFLVGFAEALVARLLANAQLEIQPGTRVGVTLYLADRLAVAPSGTSLLSTVEESLLSCPDVVELYVDREALKEEVEALRT
jgi:hypothetical protein